MALQFTAYLAKAIWHLKCLDTIFPSTSSKVSPPQRISDMAKLSGSNVMRAAQATDFGSAEDVLTIEDGVQRPFAPQQGFVTIRVCACSLSPSDYRMLSGAAKLVKKPASWPYIPGGDVAGDVVAIHSESETRLKLGDRVIGTWEAFGVGGLAQYINVATKYVEKIPPSLSYVDAAAIADSAVNAMLATEDVQLQPTDSLLVLGGSGGVGTALIQIARHIGVKDIVATSTDQPLLTELGASAVVNYRDEPWYTATAVTSRAPFDVIIDCAEGVKAWQIVCERGLVKSGNNNGRFIAVVVNDWHIIVHRWTDLVGFMFPPLRRSLTSRLRSSKLARYDMLWPAPRGDSLKRLVALYEQGGVRAVLHDGKTFPFTTDGVRQAFDIMINRKAHGKVVVKISE